MDLYNSKAKQQDKNTKMVRYGEIIYKIILYIMRLTELPEEILDLICQYVGIDNLSLSRTCTMFFRIGKRYKPSLYRDRLYKEGDIKTIIRYKLPFTVENIQDAISNGHLRVLKWAYKNKLKLTYRFVFPAIENNQIHILKWMKNKVNFSRWFCANAAATGSLQSLIWLRKNKCPWDEWTCIVAAENGHLELLIWAKLNGCPWSREVYNQANKKGQIEILKWLREEGYY